MPENYDLIIARGTVAAPDGLAVRDIGVRGGKIVAEESIAELLRRHSRRVSVLFSAPIPNGLEHVRGFTVTEVNDQRVELSLAGSPNELLHFLSLHDVEEIAITPPTLEDIFMSYYGAAPSGQNKPVTA